MKKYRYDFSVSQVTHRVNVRSLATSKFDTKSFSISAPKNKKCVDVLSAVKDVLENELKYLFDEKVDYVGEKESSTHNIIIIPKDNLSEKSCSFSIITPSYSATEICDLIQEYLWGGKFKKEEKKNEQNN